MGDAIAGRLGIGCAQFGSTYGVANVKGKLPPDEGTRVLALAARSGVDTLDTAMAYGDSEAVLGELGVESWRVITKLPPLPEGTISVRDWVRECLTGSLHRLRIRRLYGVLLHRSADLVSPRGRALRAALRECQADGYVTKVGVSIYAPAELDALVSEGELDLVQAPFNVLDRRLEESGWLERLRAEGIEIHARSVFLQGLLLMPQERRPEYFRRWQNIWDAWDGWLGRTGSSALAACLAFVLSRREFHRVIVGVDSAVHLSQILSASHMTLSEPAPVASDDIELIEPFRWKHT